MTRRKALPRFLLLLLFTLTISPGCGRKAEKRAGGPADSAPGFNLTFTDVTEAAGIRFTHNNGAFGGKLLPETMGTGLAFLDFDGDGDQDLFIVNGRDWTDAEVAAFKKGSGADMAPSLPARIPKKGGTSKLYQNNGDGTFTDVTAGSGIDVPIYGMGAAVGDYDNDGDADLFVTGVGRSYLFRNVAPGQFQEVAQTAGVAGAGWSTSAAFLDYDKDGKLDVFVCHYVVWSPGNDVFTTLDGKHKAYTTPEQYAGEACRLYHNVGGGRFADVSAAAGISHSPGPAGKPLLGKSLGVVVIDFNNDGWPDIAVANDTEPNFLFRNNGHGGFEEIGTKAGIALSESGAARAAMGVDAGDIDGSGRESLLFANFSNQMIGLYRNHGGGAFADIAPGTDIGRVSQPYLGFGAFLADVDNDGRLDLFTANGHLDKDVEQVQQDVKFRQRPLLFRNQGGVRFTDGGPGLGGAFNRAIVGRGAAYADIDLDGDLDLAISTNGGPVYLLRNDGGNRNNSLRVALEGKLSNRQGIGALVEVKAGGDTARRRVRSGSSYCSQSEIPVTIGLGSHTTADSVTVRWPSGAVTQASGISAGQILILSEAGGEPNTQPFLRR